MWERRYNFLVPERTSTNIRKYSIGHLKRLLDVSLLLKSGKSISEVCRLPWSRFNEELRLLDSDELLKEKAVADLIYSMYAMEVELLESVLNNSVRKWGIDQTIISIIIPFLQKVDITSYRDTSCEAHFAVTALRRKLIAGIESYNDIGHQGPTALLFLPAAEHYDLILLYMNYILRRRGVKVLYMGTDISISNLNRVMAVKSPDLLCTYISHYKKEQHNAIFKYILSQEQKPRLCVVSDRIKQRPATALLNFNFLHFNDFEEIVHDLR